LKVHSARCRKRLATLKPGERIDPEFALDIARQRLAHELGEAALKQRRARHGDRAYYVYNQHLNYTNVCRNQCRFCAYFKRTGEAGGYTYTLDQMRKLLLDRIEHPIREIHIVGGLNPDLPYQYYLDLLALCKEAAAHAVVKAFTAVEVAYFADSCGGTRARCCGRCARRASTCCPEAERKCSLRPCGKSSVRRRSAPTAGCTSTVWLTTWA
jgi:aminodeoxyfutalosine synthase